MTQSRSFSMITIMKIFLAFAALGGIMLAKRVLTTKTQTPKDTVVLAWETAPRSIDPRFAIDANSQYLENLVHCALFSFNADGVLKPELASNYKWSSATQLEVKINTNATFWNGDAVTVDDVIATYAFFQTDAAKTAPRKGAFKNVKEIKKIDEETLMFELNEIEAPFMSNLVVGILPKSFTNKAQITEVKGLQGCGAFKLKDVSDFQINLIARKNFFKKDETPRVQNIQIKMVKEESTRFAKLVKGELDFVQNILSREKLPELEAKYPTLKLYKRPGLNVSYLGFNFKDKWTGQKPVRQAIALAIDRAAIIKHVLKDMATPAVSMLTPNDPYLFKGIEAIKFDPAAAKLILDKAGFTDPDGDGPKKRFKLTYKTTTNTTSVTIARAIAAQLGDIGIEVEVQSLEWGKFKDDVEKGIVQLWSLRWVGFKDPNIYSYTFASDKMPPNGGNRGRYSNPELDSWLKRGESVIDPNRRRLMYTEVQSIVAEDLPYVFLWHDDLFAVVSKRLKNFKLFADGRLQGLRKIEKE